MIRGFTDDDEDEFEEFRNAKCKRETEKALLVRFDEEDHWIPRSVVIEGPGFVSEVGDEGTLAIKTWFAKKEGLV